MTKEEQIREIKEEARKQERERIRQYLINKGHFLEKKLVKDWQALESDKVGS